MKRAGVLGTVGVVMAVIVLGNLDPTLIALMAQRWTVTLPLVLLADALATALLTIFFRHRTRTGGGARPDPSGGAGSGSR